MKKLILLLAGICMVFPATAQKKNFTYKFYGFVRGDLFYNTRVNMAPVDGNFYLKRTLIHVLFWDSITYVIFTL